MDQASASQEHQGEATPIFGAYRRGYDPEQVDRYVGDQQRRLDEMTDRASEAERKLAAAVGQLRELHRRVAVLESEDRSPQPAPLDTLGERVQRILQEAWEGAYALRQAAEQEVAALRERTAGEAEAIVIAARQRARAIEDGIERRRKAYLEQIELDRSRAEAQITDLHRERESAIGELLKVKEVIEATVTEISRAHRPDAGAYEDRTGDPAPSPSEGGAAPVKAQGAADDPRIGRPGSERPGSERPGSERPGSERPGSERPGADRPSAATRRPAERARTPRPADGLAPTMPVQHLIMTPAPEEEPDRAALVRNHRARDLAPDETSRRRAPLESSQAPAAVFDFEKEDDL